MCGVHTHLTSARFHCRQGFYDVLDGQPADCHKCPENTFQNTEGATSEEACQPCPDENSVAPEGSPDVGSCICKAGYSYGDAGGTVCAACAPGTYATLDDDGCQDCPAGTATPQEGSTSQSDCLCPAGSYGDVGEGEPCHDCPANSTSSPPANRAASDCYCVDGFVSDVPDHGVGPDCQRCPGKHEYPWESTFFCSCNAGYYMYGDTEDDSECVPCPAHSNSSNAATERRQCTCDAGFFGDLSDPAAECAACPEHSTSLANTQTLDGCQCNHGFIGSPGEAIDCVLCPANATTWAPNRCTCNAGFYAVDNQSSAGQPAGMAGLACAPCPPSSYNNRHSQEGDISCVRCPYDSSSEVVGSASVLDCVCHLGFFFNLTSQLCVPCPSGSFGFARLSAGEAVGDNSTADAANSSINRSLHGSGAWNATEDAIFMATNGSCRSCPLNTNARESMIDLDPDIATFRVTEVSYVSSGHVLSTPTRARLWSPITVAPACRATPIPSLPLRVRPAFAMRATFWTFQTRPSRQKGAVHVHCTHARDP